MNYFAFWCLLSSIVSFALGLLIYFKNRNLFINRICALLNLSVAIWNFGYFGSLVASTKESALMWSRFVLYGGTIFVPVLFLHFTLAFLSLKQKKLLYFSYGCTFVFLIFNFGTNLFVKNMSKKLIFNFYSEPGILYHPFLVFFGVCIIYSLYLMSKEYKSSSSYKQNQIKYVFFASTIGFLGGSTNYPLIYNIPIFPWGHFLVIFYSFIITYAIVRYRLMDITIVLTRAGIFAFVYLFVCGIPFLLAYRYGLWQIAIWITFILATLGPFIYNHLRKQAEARIQAEERRAQAMLIKASGGMTQIRDLKELTNLIVYLISLELKLKNCSIYLLDKQTNQYLRRATRIPSKVLETEPLDKTNPLIQHLHTKKAPFLYEELKIQTSEDEPVLLQMQRLSASAVVPSFIEDFLIGFLVLDRRRDERVLSSQTLNTLQILANQAALAVENCIFIEERGKSLAETFHEQNLRAIGTLGAGIGHQINNRFNAIAVPAQIVSEMIESAQLDETSDQKLKGLLLYSKEAFDSIFRDALRGGRIATSLTHFSRKTEEYILVFLSKIIEEVLNVLSCKFSLEELNLKLELPSDLPPLFGNPSQLDSVFFNLLDNAHDANNKKSEEIRIGRIERVNANFS